MFGEHKAAYLFGVFNPITDAHMQMAHKAKSLLGVDGEVVFVPASDSYIREYKGYKDGDTMDAETRFNLIKHSVDSFGYKVSDVEISGKTDGKAYNTVNYLKASGDVICLGMDAFCSIPTWYESEKLLKEMYFLVFNRFGKEIPPSIVPIMEKAKGTLVTNLESSFFEISSSKVRDAYRRGDFDYIKKVVPYTVYCHMRREERNVYF